MRLRVVFTTWLPACAFALTLWGCRTRPICILYGVPYITSPAEVAGRWIGFSDGRRTPDTDLYRLELRPDQTGLLTEVYTIATSSATNQEIFRYEISRWDLATNNVLTCDFSLNGADAALKQCWPVKMTCKVRDTRLEALLRNGEGGWKQGIIFWRERDLDEKLRVLRQ